jgi:hypothetical protein
LIYYAAKPFMFELHVVVASIVMFNILEVIMEIVPNNPT